MSTEDSRIWQVVGVLAAFILVIGMMGRVVTRADTQTSDPPVSVQQSTVTESISYQGQLTDPTGAPLDGGFIMTFSLYAQPTGGSPLYSIDPIKVDVQGGYFNVGLPVPQSLFDGKALWLAINIEGETLSPRQEIRAAPYALSLRPGAEILQAATGAAIRAESSQGIGLHGTGQVYGVYGASSSTQQGSGYGGYFESATGIGVYGESTAPSSPTNLYAPGVYGYSQHGIGVVGNVATGLAVYGLSSGVGIGGSGQVYGVYGESTAGQQGQGYGGFFSSSTGIGVLGRSTALSSGNNRYAPGVYGYSQLGAGVMGEAGGPGSVAGFFAGPLVVEGDMIVTGDKTGYVVDIARNDGPEMLSEGDLVIVTGVAEPVLGDIPVPLVRKADTEASTAVIGIVAQRYVISELGQPMAADGSPKPGEYLSIVTLGAFRAIRVDASYGAIAPGDLLVSSPTPGHAMRTDEPRLGTVIGKALDSLDEGTGTVAVMVTLQ